MIWDLLLSLVAKFLRGWLKDKRHEELIRRDAIKSIKLNQAAKLADARKNVRSRSITASRRRVSARAKRKAEKL